MKKAYSKFAALALAALAFSSCSRANYATNQATTPLAETSVAQAPAASPAADMSAQVVAPMPTPAVAVAAAPQPAPAAPAVAPAPRRAPAAAVALATTAEATTLAAASIQPPAKAAKPTLVQRIVLSKVAKQLTKAEPRQQNTAGVAHTAATSGSLTILLVGLVALLLGIIISANWLITAGSIVAVIGLILLLLKAL